MKPFQVPISDEELLEDNCDRFCVDSEPTPIEIHEQLNGNLTLFSLSFLQICLFYRIFYCTGNR
jgi:hypothetical protein